MNEHRLVLYEHPFAAFCWKALIALYELELAFEPRLVEGEDGRKELSRLWPLAGIPVLRDEDADVTLPESSVVIEYLDGLAGGGRLIPSDPGHALQARLWDRVVDGYVATALQKVVGDSLRPEGARDPAGVEEAHETLRRAYALLDAQLAGRDWLAGSQFTIAECAAAPALFYARVVESWDEGRLESLTRYYRDLMHRPSVRRVVDEARPYRDLFPLSWTADVDAHQPGRPG